MASVKEKDPSPTAEMMAAETAEAVLEDEESMDVAGENGDLHENGADGDDDSAKDKKEGKKNRYFIPSRLEFRQDRIREQQERTVIVGPTTLDDLVIPKLMENIRGSMQFFIRFFKGPVVTESESQVKSEPQEEFKGHIEIRFSSVHEAEECVTNLSNFREGVVVRRITYDYSKEEEYLKMRKIGNPPDQEGLAAGHRAARMVAITGLAPDISKQMITEQVTDSVEVMIPKSYTSEEPEQIKGYAYIELPSADRVKELENKEITLAERNYKVHALMEIPALDSVIRRIDKERPADTPTRAMEQAKKERLRLLLRYASHYERVEDLPEAKLEAIKKRVTQIRKRLKAEARRTTTTNRGAGRGRGAGSRGFGMRGGLNRGRGSSMGWTGPGRGGYYPRGRGSYNTGGYNQRPMSGGYGSGYSQQYEGYGYPGGYEDYEYGHGDYGRRMGPSYGAQQSQRGGRGLRRGMSAGSYYGATNPRMWYD